MRGTYNRQRCFEGNSLLLKLFVLMSVILVLFFASVQATYAYTAVKGTVTVKSGKARKEPSTDSTFVFGVTKDETVIVIGEEKGKDGKLWYKVKVLNSVGYLRSDLVKKSNVEVKSESTKEPEKTSQDSSSAASAGDKNVAATPAQTNTNAGTSGAAYPTVKGSNVIVREEATTKSGIRVVVQNGQPLAILSTTAGEGDKKWHYVSFKKDNSFYKGYIRSDLVNPASTASASAPVDNSASNETNASNQSGNGQQTQSGPQIGKIKGTGVNIRKSPVDGEIVAKLTTGNQITVTAQEKGSDDKVWFAISFISNKAAKTGYVRSDLTEGIAVDESLTKKEEPAVNEENKNPAQNENSQSQQTSQPVQNDGKATASIKGIGVRIREQAVSGNVITQLDAGYPIEVVEETDGSDGYKWYKVKFSKNDTQREGFVRSDLVNIVKSEHSNQTADEDFEKNITEFPEAYKPQLRALHEKYPNWQFVPVNTGLDWNDVVANESKVGRNLVAKTSIASWKSTAPQAYDWNSNQWYGFDGGSWAAASTELIQYYLDPRNFLDDSGIFQFETLEYQDYQTVAGTSNALAGTFMSGDFNDTDGATRNYAQSFYEAGQAYGVNPYHLASKAIQEQGVLGKSQSISGNVAGLENLFNYFNIGAFASNGRTATVNGLIYASGSEEAYIRPWNTRYKSICGSAKYIADKYISAGQNTLYFQKFNVVNSKNGIYSHQYMSNVVAASYESARIRKAYSDLNTKLVFRIPYYNNMPATNCIKPTSDSNPNTYLSNLWVEGYSFTTPFSSINATYYLTVGSDVTSVNIGATPVSGSSSVGGTGVMSLNPGENKFQIVCKSQSGATKGYVIIINKQ